MNGLRFYADYGTRKLRDADTVAHRSTLATTPAPARNAIAVSLDKDGRPLVGNGSGIECLAATMFSPNSDVSVTVVSPEYLRDCCRRIGETEARRIHPRLFERLDQELKKG